MSDDEDKTLRDVAIAPELLAEWHEYMIFALDSEDLDEL